MASLPGSVGGTDLARAPHKALVHGVYARAASMHKNSGFLRHPNLNVTSSCLHCKGSHGNYRRITHVTTQTYLPVLRIV